MRTRARSRSRAGRSRASTRRCTAWTGTTGHRPGAAPPRPRLVPPSCAVSSRPTVSAATSAVPHDSPARIPSSRVSRRAAAKAAVSETRSQRSTTVGSYVPGKKSSPMPSVRYGRAVSPDRMLPSGSAPIDLDRRVLRLEVVRHATDRAAGPDRDDQVRHAAVGLPPDLGATGRLVGRGVLHVVVLVGLVGAGDVSREPARHRVVALRRIRAGRWWGRGRPRRRTPGGAPASRSSACRPSRRCSGSP